MKSNTNPTVSVIVPAFNVGRYVREAIESLLVQTFPPTEIVVVDDGSADNTAEILESFAEPVRVIRQQNRGASAARNLALSEATGDYVALFDSDDVSAPTRLERQVEILCSRSDAVACCTGYWRFDDRGRIEECPATDLPEPVDPLDVLAECRFFGPSLMFRRSRTGDVRFPVDLKSGEDIVFGALLATRGHIVTIREPLYGYRAHAAQSSRGYQATATSNRFFEDRYQWARRSWQDHWPDRGWPDVERHLWEGLARQTEENYWARNRRFFENDRAYLRSNWPPHLPRARVIDWRWYPDWLWFAKSTLDRLRGRLQ